MSHLGLLFQDCLSSFGLDLIAVGLVLRLESKVWVCRAEKHLTVKVSSCGQRRSQRDISDTYLILTQSL